MNAASSAAEQVLVVVDLRRKGGDRPRACGLIRGGRQHGGAQADSKPHFGLVSWTVRFLK